MALSHRSNGAKHHTKPCSTKCGSYFNRNNSEFQSNTRLSHPSLRYTKKLPISFIGAKDWSFYIHFSNKPTNTNKKPKNRINRLMNSFLKLYQEYSYVCDNILPPYGGGHSTGPNISNINNEAFANYGPESDVLRNQYPSNMSGFHDHTSNSNINRCTECKPDGKYENGLLKRWFSGRFRHLKSKNINYTQPYDKICRYQHETIEVYSTEKMENVISHRISFTGFDSVGRPKIKWIQVPIALELLIPKIQSKIQRIMMSCGFLYDPLEVASELRYFNYDVDLCISHFQRTKKFRDILEEFLPQKSHLQELENHPQLWQRFKGFLDKVDSEPNNCVIGRTPNVVNKFNKNTGSLAYGDTETMMMKTTNDIENDNSQIHSKLIKVVCSIEKLKLSKSEIQQLIIKTQIKYKKQITEYSTKIIRVVEFFKDFLMTDEQRGRVIHLLKQNDELKLKLKEEEKKRKMIYNMMQDQLGNVRVYCRCRAFEKNHSVLDIKTNDTVMIQSGFCEEYKFDKVFEPFRSQAAIYEEFQPLIMSFIDGFNVCFITYGGEASGKTYTLLGATLSSPTAKDSEKHDGMMNRALKEVLAEQASRKRDWEYQLSASVVEIYNDTFIDLLTGDTGIHLPIDRGLEKVQESLKIVPINCDGDIEALIKVCKLKRRVGKTALNPQSSRSHLITMIHLTGRSKIHGETISSFLAMCDLAGFEDILKAETHNNQTLSKEAGYINKSLTAFNRVFTSLRRQDPNTVSYRDTKLTYLLKPFLTNQGKCVLIVTVRTDKFSISSTQSTLRFGRESRGVALGKAKRQANLDKIKF